MKIAVIGAGASGCMAALAAAEGKNEVFLFDGNQKIGRKIYATGNGRCNLTNLTQDPGCYLSSCPDSDKAWRIISHFPAPRIIDFFEDRGILLHSRGEYVYPRTDQASTVAGFFELALQRAGVRICLGTFVREISRCDGTFQIRTDTGEYEADRVILSCGGFAGGKYGCTGDGYRFASSFGHTVLDPHPALTYLCVREKSVRRAAGVRCRALVELFVDGQSVRSEEGELQITKQGLSGIVIFQLSRFAALALSQHRQAALLIDFLPEMRGCDQKWQSERTRRLGAPRNMMSADWMLGLAARGVIDMLLDRHGIASEKKASRLDESTLEALMDELRAFHFTVSGTGGFDSAQTTEGGVPLDEISDELESLLVPGLYITGETADVDGLCGGYNLTWAFSTGHTAGVAAGRRQSRT